AAAAVVFSVVIGLSMHLIFRGAQGPEAGRSGFAAVPEAPETRSLGQTAAYFAVMVAMLVAINRGRSDPSTTVWYFIYRIKWFVGAALALVLLWMLARWFDRSELRDWSFSTWIFAKQIFPLLFAGVLVSGFLLGRPGHEGIIPGRWVERLAGGNGLGANIFASVAGALMYFATLTEVPILQGLIGSGMGQGPALALLLAGPALSLPGMLVIRQVMGTHRALVYILLVVAMSTLSGMIYGDYFSV
ncbi:MAG: permease, partial [Acidobacteria bacterium]|nr:permease [Acidobacteriota bacterium]